MDHQEDSPFKVLARDICLKEFGGAYGKLCLIAVYITRGDREEAITFVKEYLA